MSKVETEAIFAEAEEMKLKAMHDETLSDEESAELWHDGVMMRGMAALSEYHAKQRRNERILLACVGVLAFLMLFSAVMAIITGAN